MIVRLTYCKINPDSLNEVKAIYNRDIVPAIRAQKGNLGVRLMQPLDKSDDFISVSEWVTQQDADNYESSGMYKTLVGKVAGFFTKQPVLKTYSTEEVLEVQS